MLNLQMTFFGSIELCGYKQYMKGSSRKKYLKISFLKHLAPFYKGFRAKEKMLTLEATEEEISGTNLILSHWMHFLFCQRDLEYFKHANMYRI